MKKLIMFFLIVFCAVSAGFVPVVHAYNFGNYRSETLAVKAWEALEKGDLDAVLAYTNKNIELYSKQAKNMQQGLEGYVEGSEKEIFSKWALNDIATSYFIQGEAYRKASKLEEAKAAYKTVIEEYSYGQTWDPKWKGFWKPAEAAKEKLAMLDSGSSLDFGDYSSSFLTTQAWKALEKEDIAAVTAYTDKVVELYKDKAKEMQTQLKEFPIGEKEQIFSFWALNDVGTSLYIKAEALRRNGKNDQARETFEQLVAEYYFAQCFDPSWDGFWKPAEAAQQALDDLAGI